MSNRSQQNARYTRAGKQARENALRTGVQAPKGWTTVASWRRAWQRGQVASFEIPVEHRDAATK